MSFGVQYPYVRTGSYAVRVELIHTCEIGDLSTAQIDLGVSTYVDNHARK
jgi:hypothetical protein